MSFYDPKLPNVELVLYKAKQFLSKDSQFLNKMETEMKDGNNKRPIEFDLIMFPQIWGSTCTGFDVTPDGSPVMSGCAMTKEYTTIVHELLTDTYTVFFGDTPCYQVHDANNAFCEDLGKRQMASLSEAKKRY